MNEENIKNHTEYGQKYSEFLLNLKDSETVHQEISAWHEKNKVACKAYQKNLNLRYNLSGDGKLVETHPPTTAVGSFNGLVVVAANPGYHEKKNNRECEIRKKRGDPYFFKNFFSPEEDIFEYTSKIEWWKRVTKFAYVALEGKDDIVDNTNCLWDWANKEKTVGSIDLLPFHSKKDSLTDKITNNNDRSAGSPLEIASASVDFVINGIKPKLVIVSSAAGAGIARKILPVENRKEVQLACEREIEKGGETWRDTHCYMPDWYVIPNNAGSDTHVIVFPFQIFSKMTGHASFLVPLAKQINSTILNGQS